MYLGLRKSMKKNSPPSSSRSLDTSRSCRYPESQDCGKHGRWRNLANKKLLDAAATDLGLITGQKAVKTKAKKSIANFKLRQGNEVGVMVTLRGAMMYEFFDRFVNVALPRVKDFRGINPNGFDGHGNYSMGITEQIIFPEIDFDKIERVAGLNINVVTTAKTDAEAKALLAKFGMPFRK